MSEKNLTFALSLVLAFGAGVLATLFVSKKKTTTNIDVDTNRKSIEPAEAVKTADAAVDNAVDNTNREESKVEAKVGSNIESTQPTDKDEEEDEEKDEEDNRTIEVLSTTRINLTLTASIQTAKEFLLTQPGPAVSTLHIVYGKKWFRRFKDQYYSLVDCNHGSNNFPLHIEINTDSEIADDGNGDNDHSRCYDQILSAAHILMNHRGFKTVTCSKNYCTGFSFLLTMACDRFVRYDHVDNNDDDYYNERRVGWPTYQTLSRKQDSQVRDFFHKLAEKNGLKNLDAYSDYFCDANGCWRDYFDKDTIPSFLAISSNI